MTKYNCEWFLNAKKMYLAIKFTKHKIYEIGERNVNIELNYLLNKYNTQTIS